MLFKTLLVILCLCPAIVGFSREKDEHKLALLKYGIVTSQLSKEIAELEKNVVHLRKSYGKTKAKEIELSSLLEETIYKVSGLESKKTEEDKEIRQKKLARKIAKESAKSEELSITLELTQRELEDIKSALIIKETDLRTLRILHRKLKAFSTHKKILYDKFISSVEIASYWQAEYEAIVEGITSISQPIAALEAIDSDQSLCSLDQLDFLASLSVEQVKAWKITKSNEDEQLNISDLSHIQNHYQIRLLNYLLEKKIFKARHLEELRFIDSKLLAEAFIYLTEHSQEAPLSFWQNVSGMNRDWQRSPRYIFESMMLLIQTMGSLNYDLWDLLPNWNNQNALTSLKYLLEIDYMREKLGKWSVNKEKIEDLDIEPREMLLHSSQISNREQLQAFHYYCSLYGTDPNLRLEKTILNLLGFKPQMLVQINTSAKLRGLMLLTKQYSASMRKKRPDDFNTFPWEKVVQPFPFERLNTLNPYQVQAIEIYVEKKKNIPSLTEFSYIDNQYKYEALKQAISAKVKFDPEVYDTVNSHLDVELFTLCLKHQRRPGDPDLHESFRKIPYRLRSFAKQIYAEVLEQNNEDLNNKYIDALDKINSISSLKMIKFIVENSKQDLLGDWVLTVDNEAKFEMVKKCFENFDELPLADLMQVLPQITHYDDLFLLEAMIVKGLDIVNSFKKLRFANSLAEKIKLLDLTDQYWQTKLDEILKDVPDLMDEDEQNISEKLESNLPFKEFLNTYKNSSQVEKLISASYLRFCRTKNCPGLLVPSEEGQVRYCSACNQANCESCQQYAHAGTCQEFAKNSYKVDSRFYPGAANFRKNLHNVCFFNSLMKLMTQLASTVPEFENFLNPSYESAAFEKAGEGKTEEYNGLRQKLKYALHRWISLALRGYDLYDDKLADLSHQILKPLSTLLKLDHNDLNEGINRDQLDSWHILSILFSILGFEYSDLAAELEEKSELRQVDYVSHTKYPASSLSVDIAGHSDLNKAIDQMWEPETTDPDNWLRHSDGKKYETHKSIKLINSPKLLVVHQKRFIQERALFGSHWVEKKLTHSVKISPRLKIPRFDPENQDEPTQILEYELVALTLHRGNRIDSGHYIAFTVEPRTANEEGDLLAFIGKRKVFPNQFISHDDARVGKVGSMAAASKAANHEAYLLAYRLVENAN